MKYDMMNGLSSTIARRSIFITAVILGVLIRVWLWWVIPAIGFVIFVTSETPTVLGLLAGMALIPADTFLAAGFLIALVVLARTNLAGLLGTLPLVIQPRRKAAAFAAVAILPVLAWPFWVQ